MKSSIFAALLLLPNLLNAQTPSLPTITGSWINDGSPQRSMIQAIGVKFDRNVAPLIQPEALTVRNIDTGEIVDLSGATLRFDPRNNTASWIIGRSTTALLPDGNYIAWFDTDTLVTERGRAACAASATPLDDFVFGFHQVCGDADGDRDVDFRDACVLRETWQQQFGQQRYLSYFDFNISDSVEESDRSLVADTYFSVFPPDPAIHLFLRNDTGDSFTDGATSLYHAAFSSVDTGDATIWRASIDGGAFSDITPKVSNASAILDESFIDGLNGTPLALGQHQLKVEALAADGSILASSELTFEYLGDVPCAPFFITTPPPGVSLGSVRGSQPLSLANWTVENYPGSQGASNWVLAPDGLSVEQTRNAQPSALISNQSLLNLRVTGTFRVDTSGDDDLMGFIFGYQNSKQFYVFDWKQNSQGYVGGTALRGMSIKRFDAGDRDFTEPDFWWSDRDRENTTVLSPPNDIPWKDFQDYQITLEFTPGNIVVEVREEGVLLDRLEVADDTFTGGRFGFYNYSQDSVIYSGFTTEQLDNVYYYDSEAEDPDGTGITYSFGTSPGDIPPPPGATINAANGTVLWQPSEAGTFTFTIVATDTDGLTDTQTFNVEVTPIDLPPTITIRKTAPSVLPGEEVGIQAIASDDQQVFRTRLFIDDVEVDPNVGQVMVSTTRTFSTIGQVELRAIAIDSADQVSEVVSYIRVLDPNAPAPAGPGQTPIAPPGSTAGNATDLRPLVSFQAPLSPADDPTAFLGTVDPNGGTLAHWLLEWAPASKANPANLNDPSVLWQKIAEDTVPKSAELLANITPANYPNELITFRLRAENTNGLGRITAITFNPTSSTNTAPPPQTTGSGSGIRPTAAFTAPLGPADDSTRIRADISANGGTLRSWVLDYAPRTQVDLGSLSDSNVSWTFLARGTTPLSNGLLKELDPASLPNEPLVFRLSAFNESNLGTVVGIVFNPSANNNFSSPSTPSGNNPATGQRPVTRITSPRTPTDDKTMLIGSVLANGGTLDRYIVDYAPLGDVNSNDLSDPSVAWTELVPGNSEKTDETLAPLTDPVFDNGKWVIRLRAFNSNGLGSLATTTLDSGDQSVPSVAFTSPAPESDLSYITDIRGTISAGSGVLDEWTLEYAPADSVSLNNLNAAADWVELARGNTPLDDAKLGSFDPSLLRNGSYILRLRAFNTSGRGFADGLIVFVCGQTKLGNFRIEFEDLNIPVSGIPIKVRRIYDSLDTGHQGDFGPGWSLALCEADLTETVPDTGADFFNATPFEVGTRVFITSPTGERLGFTFNVRDRRNSFLYTTYAPYFVPDPGVVETLRIAPRNYERVELGEDGAVYTVGLPFGYNPDSYILTTGDGLEYEYDQRSGLKQVSDGNGNKLTFSRNAIEHSDGTSVGISRDAKGRITKITDPAGESIQYQYDTLGRLRFVTDRTDAKTEFVYASPRRPNYLTEIIDPRGISAARSEYDDDGRLIRQIDPRGNAVGFSYDPVAMTQTFTDRLGNTAVQEFDTLGNVVRGIDTEGGVTTFEYYPGTTQQKYSIDQVGNVVSRAYDARGNLIAETTGASTGEDPANPSTGFTTRIEFNDSNDPTSIVDARGNADEIDYDPATGSVTGMTSAVNAGGSGTVFTYYPNGDIQTLTDPAGNITSYAYLDRGQPGFDDGGLADATRIVDSELRNPNGDLFRKIRSYLDSQRLTLRRINYRTLPGGTEQAIAVDHTYTPEGDLELTIQPNGRIEENRYNEVGQLTAILVWKNQADFDAGNESEARVTRFDYDASGNMIKTTFPDLSAVTSTYDAEDRRISETDALGRTTRYEYDGEDRLRFTIFPDDTPDDPDDNPRTEAVYDLAGRQTDFYDEMGNRTEMQYDNRDLEIARIQHLAGGVQLVTRYEYDADRNRVAVIDPEGNRTETVYDAGGRPVEEIFPATAQNGTTRTHINWDEIGRRSELIDEEGRGKKFTYDGLGRISKVEYLDENGSPVSGGDGKVEYEYDEVGNRTAQIDANGNRTEFTYDALGNRTSRTLPGGATETFTYDAYDNMVTHTDFAGYTTRYAYDRLDRMTEITADIGHPSLAFDHAPARIIFTYAADGNQLTSTILNNSGDIISSESNTYDERSRLTGKSTLTGALSYTWQDNNLLTSTRSDGADGIDLEYSYDAANRLSSVIDNRTGSTTSYTYDLNGNLSSTTYGSGVEHAFSYDDRNRLIGLEISDSSSSVIDSFAYELNPRGDRSRMSRAGGRIHDYTYDDLYRLRSENLRGGAASDNGLVEYDLDKNGNRLARNSSVPAISSQSMGYDADDRMIGTNYDANGNTLTSPLTNPTYQGTDVYDFRNRLIRRTKIDSSVVDLLYDAEGIRISKTITSGATRETTQYLIDDINLTGYSEAVEERNESGGVAAAYSFGSDLISQRLSPAASEHYFLYDGSGSVAALLDATGAVIERYFYDAYGKLLGPATGVMSEFLYRGERFDSDLGLYYLRARYSDPNTGRFWSADRFDGFSDEPLSLHRYLYANANPVTNFDPSGFFSIMGIQVSFQIQFNLRKVQAYHIERATQVLAKKLLETSILLAERYLDFRGFARLTVPGIGVPVFDPRRPQLPLGDYGFLMADMIYSQSLAFFKAAFAAKVISVIAGSIAPKFTDIVKPKYKLTFVQQAIFQIGKFGARKLGTYAKDSVTAALNKSALYRLVVATRDVWVLLQKIKSAAENVSKFLPLPLMAYDYYRINEEALAQSP
ncbi:RHS repeat-associated core domain-containing protein [Haloferula chungangensis]|uniref:RHS repeat-associated core domain-containing protein n=1 Tax=Haloferula chungangensis TaxID=1048331 RepID=A0ABW2L6H4_9BACT